MPPHARAVTFGRGHRFAAYPRCSADHIRFSSVEGAGAPMAKLGRAIACWFIVSVCRRPPCGRTDISRPWHSSSRHLRPIGIGAACRHLDCG